MKKQGFTLIELIVVIAIIGVLAAILVPAMIGYVTRSKIATANTAAKEVFNAVNLAMVEMEVYDLPPRVLFGTIQTTGSEIASHKGLSGDALDLTNSTDRKRLFCAKIYQYFSDVEKVNDVAFTLSEDSCIGVGVLNGRYPGTYPIAITIDIYQTNAFATGGWTSLEALKIAAPTVDISSPKTIATS